MVGECRRLLYNVMLQEHSLDQWQWQLHPVGGYSFRDAYQLHTTDENPNVGVESELIWHRYVPTKVSTFAWRLLRDRLPTKDNLAAWGIISQDLRLCANGCSELKSARHLFISCTCFRVLWRLVRAQIGVSTSEPNCISDHFIQFTFLAGSLMARHSLLQLICLACVWVMWSEK